MCVEMSDFVVNLDLVAELSMDECLKVLNRTEKGDKKKKKGDMLK